MEKAKSPNDGACKKTTVHPSMLDEVEFLFSFTQDLRFAMRLLRQTPAYAFTVVITLGIGLGLNTMLFTLFNAYVLRPRDVHDPYSLYQLSSTTKRQGVIGNYSWKQYHAIRDRSPVFSDAVATRPFYARVDDRNLQGSLVSGNYFSMLGAQCAIGRLILPQDAPSPGSQPVVVLANPLWKSAFAGDPSILGRKIRINGHPFEVIGVTSSDFMGLGDLPEDFYVPGTMAKQLLSGTDPFGADAPQLFAIVGRIAPGISISAARAGLTLAVRRATEELPEQDRAIEAILTSRATVLPPNPRLFTVFSPLIVAFVLVLVICCANAANMMLARAIARQREIGVRLALGASRARLVRQLLSEGLLLAVLSGVTAYGVAFLGIRGAQRLLIGTLPATFAPLVRLAPLTLDIRVLLFLIFAAALATILSGLAPALQATKLSLTDTMRGEFSGKFRPQRLRFALVVWQISVCLLLLVVTGQLVRSSSSYQHMDVGFDPHGIVSPIWFDRPPANFNSRMAQYLAAQAWVGAAAAALRAPALGLNSILVNIPATGQNEAANYNLVSAEYFSLIGIPILRGRNFNKDETESEASVAIISQATAQRYWPGKDALGRTIEVGRARRGGPADQPAPGPVRIIGIAKDIISGLLVNGPDATMVYLPTSLKSKRSPSVLIRARGDHTSARTNLEAALRAVQPDRAGIAGSIDDTLALQMYPFIAASWIGFSLGLIALALSISGMYGVMTYIVSQRGKEIGIRMALGASPGRIVALILGQSGRLATLGIALGLAFCYVAGLALTRFFFMIRMFDWLVWVIGSTIVAAAAGASSFFPARKASLVDPVETLRAE